MKENRRHRGKLRASQPFGKMVCGDKAVSQPSCLIVESWEQAIQMREQLADVRAGALSGAALLEGLAQLVKSAETVDTDTQQEEDDPVTEWLIHKLKELIQGKPRKDGILSGLRSLLREAGEWEQLPKPTEQAQSRGRPTGSALRQQSRSRSNSRKRNNRSRSRSKGITFEETGWQEQTKGGRKPKGTGEKGETGSKGGKGQEKGTGKDQQPPQQQQQQQQRGMEKEKGQRRREEPRVKAKETKTQEDNEEIMRSRAKKIS